jgi:hypothetical protein
MKKTLQILLILGICAISSSSTLIAAEEPSTDLPAVLKKHVLALTGTANPRSYQFMESLNAAADYVEGQLKSIGLETRNQEYIAKGKTFKNIVCRIDAGKPKTVLIGAHYDVCGAGPGADDNASGVAGLIELARILHANRKTLNHNIEIIAYTNEEPPFFRTKGMGSYVHAESIKKRKHTIEYMIALEMIGYYSARKESQTYPVPEMKQIYPSTGTFIAVVGNNRSADIVTSLTQAIKENSTIDCQSLVAPPTLTGMDFSDHVNYWDLGMKAVMITDTAFYRNKNYHQRTDSPATLDYKRMAEVVKGLASSFGPIRSN